MPKDRDQLTPDDPDDAEYLASHRGQGTGGTGLDQIGTGPEDLGDVVAAEDGAEPEPDA